MKKKKEDKDEIVFDKDGTPCISLDDVPLDTTPYQEALFPFRKSLQARREYLQKISQDYLKGFANGNLPEKISEAPDVEEEVTFYFFKIEPELLDEDRIDDDE